MIPSLSFLLVRRFHRLPSGPPEFCRMSSSAAWMGLHDPRSYGSGNPGATNVLRSGSKSSGTHAVAGRCQGLAAGFSAHAIRLRLKVTRARCSRTGRSGCFHYHLYPAFRFKGGKGAYSRGRAVWIQPLAACWWCWWILMAAVLRYSSLAALSATAVAAPLYWLGANRDWWTRSLSIRSHAPSWPSC